MIEKNRYLAMIEKKASLAASIRKDIGKTSGAGAKIKHLAQLTFGGKKRLLKEVQHLNNEGVSTYKALEQFGGPGDKLRHFPFVYEK